MSLLARQLAGELGAEVVSDLEHPPSERVHVHLTDRLFGATPEQAAATLVALCRRVRTTVTLHDVPQPTDGALFERRRECYRAVMGAAAGWATSSFAELGTLMEHCRPASAGHVIPLPVLGARPTGTPPPTSAAAVLPGDATLGVFGWIYPGKGHDVAIAAASVLGTTSATRPRVVALGRAAPGHDDLVRRLQVQAAAAGVRFECTGWLPDAEVGPRLAATTVALAAHANVSASGSLNSWLAAGRRPLVRDSAYVREMARLRPGTLQLYPADAGVDALARLVDARLQDPHHNALGQVSLRPDLADTADAYRDWWAT